MWYLDRINFIEQNRRCSSLEKKCRIARMEVDYSSLILPDFVTDGQGIRFSIPVEF